MRTTPGVVGRPKARTRVALLVALLVAATGYGGVAFAATSGSHPSAPPAPSISGSGSRVDLVTPTFSNPTSVTNRWFPKSTLAQVVQLGTEGGDQMRFEATQLEDTRTIDWNGGQVETYVTQFVAYRNGRMIEVALDYYAQADNGSVWYFGEEVDNYNNGVVADHNGTWLAGRDGPPGMIMPAKPRVGDVYRPENIPGLVFEEATVMAVNQTVDGPRGPVHGAILVEGHLMDGSVEEKFYAPGYGEFRARVVASDELYQVAIAAPRDRRGSSVPAGLSTISDGAADVFDAAPAANWDRISATVVGMRSSWDRYRTRQVPELLATQMTGALDALENAVAATVPADVRQAAIGVAGASLDLQLQFEEPSDIDEARLEIWGLQLAVDTARGDTAAVAGDHATLVALKNRIRS
jgi:hypothetical protein